MSVTGVLGVAVLSGFGVFWLALYIRALRKLKHHPSSNALKLARASLVLVIIFFAFAAFLAFLNITAFQLW